ncbi:MAG: DNA polymerase III subunit gamma/tau C-terminal domain-containing protein, partial [Pollutimonas bauzanensis]
SQSSQSSQPEPPIAAARQPSNPPARQAVRADEQDAAFETLQTREFESAQPQEFEPMDEGRYEPVDMGDPGFDMPEDTLQGAVELAAPVFAAERKKTRSPRLRGMSGQAWPALAATLPVTGLAAELARQSEWLGVQGEQINLRVAIRTLAESPGKARLCTVLSEHFGTVVQLNVEYGATGDETAHAVEQAQKAVRQQEAEQAVAADPFVQTLISEFGAKVVPGSIRAAPLSRAA